MVAAITVEGLTVGWGDTALLRDISFDVPKGETFVILGGSGCGKSTLLQNLVGLQLPMAGRIRIEGVGAPDLTAGRPAFGVMFQSAALFGSMTLLENVSLPLRKWTRLPPDAVRAVALGKLEMVELGGFDDHLPAELSGGMKKRAGIARALALEPPLLFLDEPSAGLDPITAAGVDELLLALNQALGVTIVLVTHDLACTFKVGRECIMLDKDAKGIIARGDPRELRDSATDPRVADFFNRRSRKA